MKRVIFTSIAAILLIAVLVIFVIPVRCSPAPQTLWNRWGTKKAIEDYPNSELYIVYEYYYGKYNGYYIVSSEKNTCAFSITTIGEHTFCFNSYNIGVWKDGMRFNLEDAYKQGKISDKDLEKIHKYHLKTLRDFELEAIGEGTNT